MDYLASLWIVMLLGSVVLADVESTEKETTDELNITTERNAEPMITNGGSNDDGTTLCPEELERQKAAEQQLNYEKQTMEPETRFNNNESSEKIEETTSQPENQKEASPEGVDETTTLSPEEITDLSQDSVGQTDSAEETTTPCPEELKGTVSLGSLLKVQKNSALLKLVEDKLANRIGSRQKRQATADQYKNAQVIASNKIYPPKYYKTLQQQSNYYNSRIPYQQQQNFIPRRSNLNIRLAQQPQQQYRPNYKYYTKNVKPATHPRYSNKKNYYTNGDNRRQFQASAPLTSTTLNPTIKRKFRPSPVFP